MAQNANNLIVRRGELYWLDWNPARGSEQAGRRPALVVQENAASANPNYPLTIVVAISTSGRSISAHVAIEPSASNNLSALSFAKCEQIQTVSKARLLHKIGTLDPLDISRVTVALKAVLALL